MSCNDYIQILQPYEPSTNSFQEFDANSNYFQKRTEYSLNSSITGWINEDSPVPGQKRFNVFSTISDKCPPSYTENANCHERRVFYDTRSGFGFGDEALNMEYNENYLAVISDATLDGVEENGSRGNTNFIGASISDQT